MNLDNLAQFKKIDNTGVGKAIELLPDQIREVLTDARLIKIPSSYAKVTNVVVSGMGGSNIGARILKYALADELKLPLLIEAGYEVPKYVNKNTLFIVSSYSGNTEEPLKALKKAKKQGAKIVAITSASQKNKLAKLMLKNNIPGYIYKTENNPSGQPRLGLGYTMFGTAVIMAKAGLFNISVRKIEHIIASMEIWTREFRPTTPTKNNQAKKIALELEKKNPVLIAAEFLRGNAMALRNQMSENSKHLPTFLFLPDLNHFAMEGLAFPKNRQSKEIFLFLDSQFYHPRVQKRSLLTKQVVKKNNIAIASIALCGQSKLEQNFEMLLLGTWITYYLGMLHKVDPVKIPWVDWFKKQLK